MAAVRTRPLSPHLTIWRWGPHMVVSILHRVTGAGLSVFGLGILVWWLMAVAGGPESYSTFTSWLWADASQLQWSGGAIVASIVKILFKLLLIGLTWAFFQHLFSGIRHLVMDTGMGFELKANKAGAIATMVGSVAATVLIWAWLLGVFQ